LQAVVSARDNAIEEKDYNLELFRARYRDLEETLTNSVLTLQEKESQIRALSSNLRDTQARLEQDIDEAKAEASKKTGELKQAENRLLDLELEHTEVIAKCRRLELQLHDLSEILVESQQRWEREIMEASEKLRVLEVRCCKAEEDAMLGGKSSKDAEAEIRKLQRHIIDLEQLKQLSLSKEEVLDQQIRSHEQTISRLEDVETQELPQVVGKCRNLEQQNQELSEILLDSQRRWESELTAANLKIAALETQRTEAEKSVANSNRTINELQGNIHTLRNKVSELERALELSASRESSNLSRIQEQDESITKLLHIEKKRLQTIMEQRAALKASEENSLVLKNEIRELKIHLELAQARDDSHMQNMEELKQLGQEREQAVWLECESEIHSLREQVRNAQLQLAQVGKENATLKSEVCSYRKERAPWPNAIAAISGNKSKGDGRNTFAGPIREVDKLRMQLDAVEKLAAERTEQVITLSVTWRIGQRESSFPSLTVFSVVFQVRTLEMELGYLEEDQGDQFLPGTEQPPQRFSERPATASQKGVPPSGHSTAHSSREQCARYP
jgi:chromosome segregation ATPase